jgi:hypothetical protein
VKRFRISHPASAEFTEAVRWYEEQRVGLGGEFFDVLRDARQMTNRPQGRGANTSSPAPTPVSGFDHPNLLE